MRGEEFKGKPLYQKICCAAHVKHFKYTLYYEPHRTHRIHRKAHSQCKFRLDISKFVFVYGLSAPAISFPSSRRYFIFYIFHRHILLTTAIDVVAKIVAPKALYMYILYNETKPETWHGGRACEAAEATGCLPLHRHFHVHT